MKYVCICILFLLSFLDSKSQTYSIAQQSHSLNPGMKSSSYVDRFGEIPNPLIRIERIQNDGDTATILYYGFNGNTSEQYKVPNHPIFNHPDINMDSLKMTFDSEIEWIGFDKKETKISRKKNLFLTFMNNIWKGPMTLMLILASIHFVFKRKGTELSPALH